MWPARRVARRELQDSTERFLGALVEWAKATSKFTCSLRIPPLSRAKACHVTARRMTFCNSRTRVLKGHGACMRDAPSYSHPYHLPREPSKTQDERIGTRGIQLIPVSENLQPKSPSHLLVAERTLAGNLTIELLQSCMTDCTGPCHEPKVVLDALRRGKEHHSGSST